MQRQRKISNTCPRQGFSLMEVLVSLVLISMIVVGLFNLFAGGKAWIAHRRKMMAGGEIGKLFLDPLQMDVTESARSTVLLSGWGQANNCLSSDPTSGCPVAQGIYTPSYSISNVAGTSLRRVRMTVSW